MTFHYTHWPIAAVIALTTAGCSPMDAIEGKPSAFQAEVERRALITLPATVPATVTTAATVPEPVNLADGIAPEPVVPEPVPVVAPCHEVYRVTRCVDGVAEDWGF